MKIKVTIQGTSPIIFNRFSEEAEAAVSSASRRSTKATKGTPREQAEPKAYKLSDGTLCIPGVNIFASIIEAGKFMKIGKSKATTQKSSLVPAAMMLEEESCSFNTKEFEVDSRSVVIPATGGRVMAHRPRLDEWETSFTIDLFDEGLFSKDDVRILVDDAGRKVGLGDFRPARKGPFGRFVVVEWKVC